MYNDMDLLEFTASQPNTYVTRILDILFSRDELKKSIVPGKKGLVDGGRVALNEEKIGLLKSKCYFIKKFLLVNNFILSKIGALAAKFPVTKKEKSEQWKNAVSTINRKCYDSAKQTTTPKRSRKDMENGK